MNRVSTTIPSEGWPATRRVLLRGVVPVVIGLVVGALLALAVTAVMNKRYTATSRVLVTATGVDSTAQANGRTTGSINLDTEAQLVTSAGVIQSAEQAYRPLDDLTFEAIVSDVSVQVPPNSSVLEIAFTADSAAMARSGANALAAAYLDDRQTNAQSLLDRQESQARQTVASLSAQLDKVANQLAAQPARSTQRALLQTRIGILKNQINGENEQIVTLGSIQITPGRVVTAASLPTHASSPSRTINTLSGAALGLLVGLFVAWLLLRYTRRVRRPEDLARVVDVPCLATLGARTGPVGEQFRRLALLAGATVQDAQRLVFAGPLDSPTASLVATGVAEALVRGGRPAALLRVNANDVNGRRPRGVPVESRPSTDAVSPGERLDAGLTRLRGDHDLLVVAVGSAARAVDAAALGAVSDAVVLVIDARTRSRDVRAAVRALDEVGAPMLGVVLVAAGAASVEPADSEPATQFRPEKPARETAEIRVEPPSAIGTAPEQAATKPAAAAHSAPDDDDDAAHDASDYDKAAADAVNDKAEKAADAAADVAAGDGGEAGTPRKGGGGPAGGEARRSRSRSSGQAAQSGGRRRDPAKNAAGGGRAGGGSRNPHSSGTRSS